MRTPQVTKISQDWRHYLIPMPAQCRIVWLPARRSLAHQQGLDFLASFGVKQRIARRSSEELDLTVAHYDAFGKPHGHHH